MSIASVEDHIVLSILHSMTVRATSGEDLEASSDTTGVVTSKVSETRPVHVPMMSSDLSDLVFVSLYSPEGTDIVSIEPTLGLIVGVHLRIEEP